MKLTKLALSKTIVLICVFTACTTSSAKPALLKYTGAFPPENGCVLPPIDSTTVGKRVVKMFAQIQHGQSLEKVRSLIDLDPIVPKIYKSQYFPMTTLSYDISIADELALYPRVSFDQNLKVKIVTISLAQDSGEEVHKACHYELVPTSK